MSIEKKLAIWMDHASAHIIDYPLDASQKNTVTSVFTPEEKKESLEKSEHIMHNKEKREHAEYYKELSNIILLYDKVLLFGPTHAKSELLNFLKADHKFDKIDIKVRAAEKMTDHEVRAYVKEYFTEPINL